MRKSGHQNKFNKRFTGTNHQNWELKIKEKGKHSLKKKRYKGSRSKMNFNNFRI